MMTILKLAILTTTMWQASVSTMEGQSVKGKVSSLTAQAVLVTDGTKESSLPLDNVLSIEFEADSAVDNSTNIQQQPAVQLADGSNLIAESLTATADQISLTNSSLKEVTLARGVVQSIRLLPLTTELELQWQSFIQRNEEKDLLVIRKKSGDGLDFMPGNVASVSETEILFLLDGDEIPVPRERVFGIVFAKASRDSLSSSIAVQFHNEQLLMVTSVSLNSDEFTAQSSWGQTFALPESLVSKIDFSTGRLHYLSDLDPITEEYFGLDPDGQEWGELFDADRRTRTGLSSQWKMSRDRFMNNGRPALTLRSQSYKKGICLFPSAKVEYALDERYSHLKAVVGVDDDVAFQQPRKGKSTVVELRIEADGELLFQQLISAIGEPIDLNLPLAGKNTLTISVDFGDDSSVCDYLDLANAVLIVKPADQ